MSFDFSKVRTGGQARKLTDPRQLFDALPSREQRLEFLRDPQGQVLETWYERRTERDLVVKMNTGSGKTLVGMLMCQSSMNEGFGPALYVAPDPYLADQAITQGRALGLEVTDNPESPKFIAGEAICVASIRKLVNGKSVFGFASGVRPVVKVGTVVIDDAHAALITLEQQTTLTVRGDLPAYTELLNLFAADLKKLNAPMFLDIKYQVHDAVLQVPFWSWTAHLFEATEILQGLRDDQVVQWTWPLVKELLPICEVVFSAAAVEIRPPCPPIAQVASFHEAKRRIYLTATLADDSILVTDFAADPASIARPITPSGGGYLGDRLILAPQEITATIGEHDIRAAVRGFADDGLNVVVLVPSHRRAQLWEGYSDVTASTAAQIAEVVARLRAKHVGVVVLVNKYDGIDLPDDACRVLVVDGLPEAYSAGDRRDRTVLGDSDAMVARQLQRIEQGMGRGVRSTGDYCVVLLMGARLSQLIATPANRSKLGPATRAQVELSREVASGLEGFTMDALTGVMRQVLNRDRDWVAEARSRLAGVTYGDATVTKVAIHQRAAFDLAARGQYEPAAAEMSKAVNAAVDDRQRGWLQEQLASYQHHFDPARAQTTLAGALKLNPYVLRPRAGVPYQRLAAGKAQAVQAAGYLAATYRDVNSLRLGFDALADDLVCNPDQVPEFEDALEHLGEHLGFTVQRPERDSGNGPDVMWALGDLRYLVIEAKSGATADKIWRKDVEQLSHSMNWFAEHYDQSCTASPIIVHRVKTCEKDAVPPQGTRIITEEGLRKLREAVTGFAVALSASGRYSDPSAVGDRLQEHGLLGNRFLDQYTVPAGRNYA